MINAQWLKHTYISVLMCFTKERKNLSEKISHRDKSFFITSQKKIIYIKSYSFRLFNSPPFHHHRISILLLQQLLLLSHIIRSISASEMKMRKEERKSFSSHHSLTQREKAFAWEQVITVMLKTVLKSSMMSHYHEKKKRRERAERYFYDALHLLKICHHAWWTNEWFRAAARMMKEFS